MSAKPRAYRVRRKYEFIRADREQFPTEVMCRELGVVPSGYYHSWTWVCPESS